MAEYRIELFKSPSTSIKQKWYWRLRETHSNKVVGDGAEGYYSAWNAKRAARKLHPGVPIAKV